MATVRPRRMSLALAAPVVAAALCVLVPRSWGAEPPPIERPESAGRIVRSFDFEEWPENPEPVPMHWVRAQHDPPHRERSGFPEWNKAAFDTSHATSGERSVLLPTEGGSASLRLSSGVIPAIPDADYMVVVNVRTEALRHARARVVARFLDERRRPIAESESRSQLIDTRGEWWVVRAELRSGAAGAPPAWIQIDLELLQPRDQTPIATELAMDPHRVWLQDVRGGAWFDDVLVYQLPRIQLATNAPSNIVVAPERPSVRLSVRDLTGESLRAAMRVFDLDGRLIDVHETDLPSAGRTVEWSPNLRAYGWSRAVLDVLNDETVVARESVDFVWLPAPKETGEEARRFMLLVEDEDAARLRNLPHALRGAMSRAAQLPAWARTHTLDDAKAYIDALGPVIDELTHDGATITFTVGLPPIAIGAAHSADAEGPLALLGAPRSRDDAPAWEPFLHDALSKFGQRVRRWQIGDVDDVSAYWRPNLAQELANAERALARLVPGPVVALPWSVEQPIDTRTGPRTALTVALPEHVPFDAIDELVSRLRERADVTLVIERPPAATFGQRAAIGSLARRAVGAWAADAPTIALRDPWTWRTGKEPRIAPSPALAAWRQLAQRLAGRRIVGELPLARGVRCFILDGPPGTSGAGGGGGGALVAWNDWASPSDARIDMRLGDSDVTVIDLFGNERRISAPEGGAHVIELDDLPVFIEGVDERLAAFHAGFRVLPGFLPAEASVHPIEVELRNPWPVAISGSLRIVEPAGWKIEPRIAQFNIGAGDSARLRLDVSFGLGEEAGVKRLVAEVDLLADRGRRRVRVGAPIELGLATLSLSPSYSFIRDANGAPRDVAVTLSITNNGDLPATLNAYAMAPGFPREQAPVSELGPGQTAVRRFVFPGGAPALLGKRVRVGLIEIHGSGRLNKSVTIE